MSDLVDSTFPDLKKKGIPPVAKLNAAERNKLPSSDFAEPGQRKFPVNDRSHAQNALARASQSGNSSIISKVKSKVAKKFPGLEKSSKSKSSDMKRG